MRTHNHGSRESSKTIPRAKRTDRGQCQHGRKSCHNVSKGAKEKENGKSRILVFYKDGDAEDGCQGYAIVGEGLGDVDATSRLVAELTCTMSNRRRVGYPRAD